MNFGDLKNKAMSWVGKNPDKANSAIDKGSQAISDRYGHEQQVDSTADRAKGYLGTEGETGQQGQAHDQGGQSDQ